MQIHEFNYTKNSITYTGESKQPIILTGLIPNPTSEVNTDDSAIKFKDLYTNVNVAEIKALCDIDKGLLATKATLNTLDKNNIQYTIKTIENEDIIIYGNAITILINYSHALKTGFIGTFLLIQKQ